MKLVNRTKNIILAEEVVKATSFWQRAKGLLGKASLAKNSTLWILRCNSIHTFFMKFPIDVVFVDKNLRVCTVMTNIKPWRLASSLWRAHSVFEFASPQPVLKQIEKGDMLYVGD